MRSTLRFQPIRMAISIQPIKFFPLPSVDTMTSEIENFVQAWKKLDVDEERQLITMENMLKDFDKHVHLETTGTKDTITSQVISDEYKGAHINFPLQSEDIVKLQQCFKDGYTLHYKYTLKILLEIVLLFKKENTSHLKHATIPKNGKLVVVGDLHGQLLDIFTILNKYGMPSENQIYVFNGDFVDRGAHSTEVLLLIYALKLAFNSFVFLNRGNHEFENLNVRYGFEDEVHNKYDKTIFRLIQDSFKLLTLYTLIDKSILVLHGGLFQYSDVTLDEMSKFKIPLEHNTDKRAQSILLQSLWSDPDNDEGFAPSDRGVGILFGWDVTKCFLKKNNLQMIIRSHEMVDEGFEWKHNNTLLTIFSASYYAGSAFNRGAVVEFNGQTGLKPEIFQYYAELSSGTTEKDVKASTLHQLKDRIFSNRAELLKAFSKLDAVDSSRIKSEQWVSVMEETIPIGVNWRALQPYLTESEDGMIDYTQFLNRYVINIGNTLSTSFQKNLIEKMCSKFVENMGNLKQAFKSLDKSGDGKVSYNEFTEILKQFDFGLTQDQMFDFASSIDTDESGTIEFEEFADRFQVQFESEIHDELLKKKLQEISKKILQKKGEVKVIFDEFDENHDGKIVLKEFETALERLGLSYGEDEVSGLFSIVDKSKQGFITLEAFEKCFFIVDSQGDQYSQNIIQKVCSAIYKGRYKLKHLFRKMDLDGNGKIDLKEFQIGINALNLTLDAPLTQDQVKIIFDAVDTDGSGEIDFEEFIKAFEVVDMNTLENK
jgi:Ca2+-binding EF-hand superfamily protein/diadenosine tetraphosphatase ApaH/serine/threonine PP2A family protein phosphatase